MTTEDVEHIAKRKAEEVRNQSGNEADYWEIYFRISLCWHFHGIPPHISVRV